MRVQPLSTANAGMTRLRSKGGASPETLYDLLNGYITLAGTIRPRPGTQTDITLPTDTKGLVSHKCKNYVFSHTPQVTSDPTKYIVATIRHPSDASIKLREIHFAAPFMGFLYVVAEFEDDNIWHYWLEELDAWSATTDYKIGDRIFPTTENGFAYKAGRLSYASEAWAASVSRAVDDVVEPTTYNGYEYKVVAVTGSNPSSGLVEPTWPTESAAQVIEYAHGEASNIVESTVLDPDPDSGEVPEDYQNLAGGFFTGKYVTVDP